MQITVLIPQGLLDNLVQVPAYIKNIPLVMLTVFSAGRVLVRLD